jgi:hypothetical protein
VPEKLTSRRLDSEVLEQLAELIVGDEPLAPKARGSYLLTRFFRDAGLPRFEHDGSNRKSWVVNCLGACSYNEIQDIILRLASPKEYAGNRVEHASALSVLNRVLAIEGIRVRMQALEPIIELVAPDFASHFDFEPASISLEVPNFVDLDVSNELLTLLNDRWREVEACFSLGAYLATTIMLGSILEAALFAALRKHYTIIIERNCGAKDERGNLKTAGQWTLADMIDIAHKMKFAKNQLKMFSHSVREYRNLVHPEAQLRSQTFPASEDCRIAAIVLCAVVRDLSKRTSTNAL